MGSVHAQRPVHVHPSLSESPSVSHHGSMHQQTTLAATMAFPSLPASPTLTNPDMILPYGEYDSTPSPPQDPMRPESPLGAWKGSRPDDMSFSIGPPEHMQMGIGPITPTTPIIYGNGTMLSDIGEVTEAESTPGRKPRPTQARLKGRDSPLRSSPTMGYVASAKRSKFPNHHRSVSEESNSTVTTEGQPPEPFKDFDDGVSVDDSNFQGDDEESIMDDNYDDEREVAQTQLIARKEGRLVESEDMSNSAALSRRAEMILANAKKRLDNMEGNLTRARSSLYITPSSSMSSIHSSSPLSRSTPSPPEAERRIIAGLGVPPAKHRQISNASVSPVGSPGHQRIFSENSIPSSLYTPLSAVRAPVAATPSPTWGEADNKDSIRTPRASPPSRSPPSRGSNHHAAPLELLSEDEAVPMHDLGHETVRASTAGPYSIRAGDPRALTRSTSSMQMRDLTDKMKDLKGKISTLRDRAREENLKRRSLQSLRTPSPFTAAEQWYTTSPAYKGVGKSANAGVTHNTWNGEPSVDGADEENVGRPTKEGSNYDDSEGPSIYQDAEQQEEENIEGQPEQATSDQYIPGQNSEQDDIYATAEEQEREEDEGVAMYDGTGGECEEDQYVDELVNHNELDDYRSVSEASLYHDSFTGPISHEDREDAFDYEHFFLHSAMGSIGRRNRSGSLDSFSSEDSVETTKGPEAPIAVVNGHDASDKLIRGHIRNQKSVDSVSTLASFATATEGRRSSEVPVAREDERDGDFAVQPVSDSHPEEMATATAVTEKRSTFGKSTPTELPESRQPLLSQTSRTSSDSMDDSTQSGKMQRPSISSFNSTGSSGTTRSFPLVNKPKDASARSSTILSEAIRLNRSSTDSLDGRQVSPVDMLAREDQILVERLVGSLGKCVLGLQEAGRASSEGRMWRRRLDAARRVLEGNEGAI